MIQGQSHGNGALTIMRRNRKTMNDVNDIVRTMSNEDKRLLGLHGKEYQTIKEDQQIAKRFIKKVNNVPVSFFDISGDSTGVAVTIGTRSGDKYRNKGYAKAVAKQGKNWLDKYYDEFDQIVWWTRKENIRSIKIAEDIGFELDESSVLPDDPWVKYQYKK